MVWACKTNLPVCDNHTRVNNTHLNCTNVLNCALFEGLQVKCFSSLLFSCLTNHCIADAACMPS